MRSIIDFILLILITIKSLAKVLIHSKFKTEIPSLAEKKTKSLIILGNGPSLNQTISKYSHILKKADLLCVNAFSLSSDFEIFQPKYYVIADPQFWKKNPIEGMDDFCNSIIQAIIEKTSWPLILFTPFESAKYTNVKRLAVNQNVKIVYYNKTSVSGFSGFRNFFFKKNIGIPRAQNVLIPSLILGINMSYPKIFITGADHSWHENLEIDDKNQLCIRDEHFYDKEKVSLRPIKDIVTGKTIHFHEQLKAMAITFELYFVIQEYASFQKRAIYNASEKSFIDAFIRSSIEAINNQ